MFAILNAAGWPIYILLLTSIVALTLIIERLFALRRGKILPDKVSSDIILLYRRGDCPPERLKQLEQATAFEKILSVAMRYRGLPRELAIEEIQAEAKYTRYDMYRNLGALGAIVTLAPLMGLFGTVVGMIEIFGAQDAQGTDPILLAHGISIALYNTGFGLIIAIISLIAHRYLRARCDDFLMEMERLMLRFLDYAYAADSMGEDK